MGFFDLNVPYNGSSPSDKATRIKIATKAMELGYSGIAYNRTMRGVMSDRDRCSIPLLSLSSLLKVAPSLSSSVSLHRELLGVPRDSPFRQYTRLTVSVESISQTQALNSGNPILKSYDLVAVKPINQSTFDRACETAEVEIISIDFSEKLPFRLKLPMVKAAIKRGVYFEITYSGLIADVQLRRQIISNAKLLVDWTRGKNLIISSGATSVNEIRGPYDVANLMSLLGISIEHAKASISKNCRTVIGNAIRKRQYYKDTIRVEAMPRSRNSDAGELWSVDWQKWDPISSGNGDLLLDDLEKSLAATKEVLKPVKCIDFASVVDNVSSHGFLVKDLIANELVQQTSNEGKNRLYTARDVETSVEVNPTPSGEPVTISCGHDISQGSYYDESLKQKSSSSLIFKEPVLPGETIDTEENKVRVDATRDEFLEDEATLMETVEVEGNMIQTECTKDEHVFQREFMQDEIASANDLDLPSEPNVLVIHENSMIDTTMEDAEIQDTRADGAEFVSCCLPNKPPLSASQNLENRQASSPAIQVDERLNGTESEFQELKCSDADMPLQDDVTDVAVGRVKYQGEGDVSLVSVDRSSHVKVSAGEIGETRDSAGLFCDGTLTISSYKEMKVMGGSSPVNDRSMTNEIEEVRNSSLITINPLLEMAAEDKTKREDDAEIRIPIPRTSFPGDVRVKAYRSHRPLVFPLKRLLNPATFKRRGRRKI